MSGNPLLNMMGNGNPIQSMMQNNPMMQVINIAKNGGNPMALLQQMASQNPQMKQIMDITNGKSQQEMNDYMKKAAQQKGIDLGQLAQSIGVPPEIATRYGIEMPK